MGAVATAVMPEYKRDPHLPPPEVCDWLLEQKWSERIPSIEMTFPEGGPSGCSRSTLKSYRQSFVVIGRNTMARLFVPNEALDTLHKDAAERQRAGEGCNNDSELEAFCDTIEDLIKNGDLKVGETVGALYMIAANLAAVANLAAKSQD